MTALTSRSNPVLADFRDVARKSIGSRDLARNWLQLLDEDPAMRNTFVWAPIISPTPEQVAHARKVLSRLVATSIHSRPTEEA